MEKQCECGEAAALKFDKFGWLCPGCILSTIENQDDQIVKLKEKNKKMRAKERQRNRQMELEL